MGLDYGKAERFVEWLEKQIIVAGRGDRELSLTVEPSGKFWLGRLAPEELVANTGMGERGDRLEPCAVGIRLRPSGEGPWDFSVHVSAHAWVRQADHTWLKSSEVKATVPVTASHGAATAHGRSILESALRNTVGVPGLSAEIRLEFELCSLGGFELTVILVNTSPEKHKLLRDTRLYECKLEIDGLKTIPFLLEALPDSFRYDRRVPAYGINCGVDLGPQGTFITSDIALAVRPRPLFWNAQEPVPDLSFSALANDPLPAASELSAVLKSWGTAKWSENALKTRAEAESWSEEMRDEAADAAREFQVELERIEAGLRLLTENDLLRKAFQLMNRAMGIAADEKYQSWRSFQFGFLLANLQAIAQPDADSSIADIVWFATGGGKTETYLGLLTTAAIFERLNGKSTGVTAWSRFPLRMLSLQQMQRFANAIAAAELVRREAGIAGDPFSLGFLVGQSSTPNSIKPDSSEKDQWDPDDESMPGRVRVLQVCPFCRSDKIEMALDRRLWKLEHRCRSGRCPWPETSLPFYVVDDEIYRFLPTIIVGTLDKAASIAMQGAMRGLVGPPFGLCSRVGHGFVYAPRSTRPNGCLVPACNAPVVSLPMDGSRFGPSFRLQDELHLLRDSLGAVDAHYEALYDGLQQELCGRKPKILGSSATLSGYEKQTEVLYRRHARVFPLQGPSVSEGFWVCDSSVLMRRYVAVAPRGVTLEYAVDRILTELQGCIRRLGQEPTNICEEVGIDASSAADLISLYGTNVVYGNTLRDLDAVIRSAETQVQVEGPLNTESLTGRTDFESVRKILNRLEDPEPEFSDRLHLISASSMMSHGIDVDRLNTMVMLGIPLTTAEFIQATARVGRRWPGLVFVMHKIGRERDASVFRSFAKYVEQGDRFVEPIPITRRSRRVLERTIAGLVLARIYAVHEPKSKSALTTLKALRNLVNAKQFTTADELLALCSYLKLDNGLDEKLIADIESWLERFIRNVRDPLPNTTFASEASPTGSPMLSLRDVEEQVPLFLNRIK